MSADLKVIRATYLETEEHCLRAWERNPKKPRFWLFFSIAFLGAGSLIFYEEVKQNQRGKPVDWFASLTPLTVLLLMTLWIGPIGQRRRLRKSLRKDLSNPPTEAWLEFAESGFMTSGKGGQSSFHPWATVPHAIEFSDGLLVYFGDNEYSFFWVPHSAFGSHQDYEVMLALVRAKVKRVDKSKR